jgi:hypothetical protein
MKSLRGLIISSFALSVIVTVLSLARRGHMLHYAHTVLVSVTFLLIAEYLRRSARLASVYSLGEVKATFPSSDAAVGDILSFRAGELVTADVLAISGSGEADESALGGGTAEALPGYTLIRGSVLLKGSVTGRVVPSAPLAAPEIKEGEPLYNPFAAALAGSGIYVKGAKTLAAVARMNTLAPRGISASRAGFARTKETLGKIGLALSDIEDAESPVALCNFRELDPAVPVSITRNKTAHLIRLVYCARCYVKLRRLRVCGLAFFALLAAALVCLGRYMYISMCIAAFEAFCLYLVRRADRAAEKRLSFSVFG